MSGETAFVEERRHRFFEIVVSLGAGLFVVYFILGLWFPSSPILDFGREDRPVEYLGALCWAGAWIICAYRLIKGQRQPLLLLITWMVLAFVFMGEEVSWFQRILGFGTPEAFEDINAQGEFNVHNLEGLGLAGLGVQNLFRLGFISYFLVLPILTASRRVRALVAKLGYSPPERAFLMAVWAVIGVSVFLQLIGPEAARSITVESRESFYAFTVLVYVYLYLRPSPIDADHRIGRRGSASVGTI